MARIRVICQCQGHPTSYILAPLVIGRNGLIQAKIQTLIANLILSIVVTLDGIWILSRQLLCPRHWDALLGRGDGGQGTGGHWTVVHWLQKLFGLPETKKNKQSPKQEALPHISGGLLPWRTNLLVYTPEIGVNTTNYPIGKAYGGKSYDFWTSIAQNTSYLSPVCLQNTTVYAISGLVLCWQRTSHCRLESTGIMSKRKPAKFEPEALCSERRATGGARIVQYC